MALMDLIRPQWKNSNPDLRVAAIRHLEDDRQDVFLPTALEDADSAIRLQAAKRVIGEPGLRKLISTSQDKAVQEIAQKGLQLVVKDLAKAASDSELGSVKAWLQEIKSEGKAIEDIALNAKHMETRRQALELLTHAGSILNVALQEENSSIAMNAFSKLVRDTHIQNAAKNACNKDVRNAAKEKLKALVNASKKSDQASMDQAKLQLLLSVVQKANAHSAEPGATYPWEATREHIDETENAYRELTHTGIQANPLEAKIFQSHIDAFRQRYALHLAYEVSRQREEKEAQRLKEVREADRLAKEEVRRQRELDDAERRKQDAETEQIRLQEESSRAEHSAQTQIELAPLVAELESLAETSELQATEKRLREIQNLWKRNAHLLRGEHADILIRRYHAALDHVRETLDWHRWSNLRRKQDFCTALETLIKTDDRKAMVARFKEILSEWKTIGPVPWENTETVWDRYHAACDALYEKCREYFAELDDERESNAKTKEEICVKLESLIATEFDWREATETFKEAQSAWKAVGAVPHEKNEALWNRFRTVCQDFYGRKDKQHDANLALKLELIVLVEGLQNSREWKATATKIKEAQDKWKSIGPVPKGQAESLWQRFHSACEKFFVARREFFDKLEQDRPANLQKKIELCEKVESVATLPDDDSRFNLIREAQNQWKEIGPGIQDQEEAVWERFRKPIDAYFQERKQRIEPERLQREENAKIKEDLCLEAESLRDSKEWKETVERMKSLQARWKATGPAPRHADTELWQRFRTACDSFFTRLKEQGAQRDQDRISNYRYKEYLCYTAEILSGRSFSDEEKQVRDTWVADRRTEGMRAELPLGPVDWIEGTEKVKTLQSEWRKTGPVPREENQAIWERFARACDLFFEERRRAMGHPAEDPQANLENKLALITEAEQLAANAGSNDEEAIAELRRRWKKIGPVPRAQSDYVWERFNTACGSSTHAEV